MVVTAKIAVSQVIPAIDKPYDYAVPESLSGKLRRGMRVLVPFGRGSAVREGIVLSVSEADSEDGLKAVLSLPEEEPLLSEEQLRLALWMRDRFFCTVYDAVKAMLPAGVWLKNGKRGVGDKTVAFAELNVPAEDALDFAGSHKKRAPMQAAVMELMASVGRASVPDLCYFTGASRTTVNSLVRQELLFLTEEETFRRPAAEAEEPAAEFVLNDEQQTAFETLREMALSDKPGAALLYGVTGSGKTPVYIRLIQEVLRLGKSAIVLVPEIGLTPQLVSIFSARFGDRVAVLHSSLGIGERYDEWKRIREGLATVVVGTRSAVFAPVKDLGLLVMDEEQERTYKSENAPRYNARDVAKYRCVQSGALLLLGSATPAVESMFSAETGKYRLCTLENRYNGRDLPQVLIADMKRELKAGNASSISSVLRAELEKNFDRDEQSILFLNRRGAFHLVVCGECGYTFTCPRCSVSMTYHSVSGRMMCHYCGFSRALPEHCPDCGGKLKFVGAGTQRVEEELRELYPDVRTIRMDTDTVAPVGSHEKILDAFREEKIPVLIGTQMVTKGLDFENVTLVGVLSADQSLYGNDFRAQEHTFSLITQVVGRSGRGSRLGRAVIQTFTPENEVIRLAAAQDYMGFYRREIEIRKVLGSPPAADLFAVTVSGADENRVYRACVKVRDSLTGYFAKLPDCRVLGPAPASVTRVNNRYRYRVSVSCRNSRQIRDTIAHVLREFSGDRSNRGLSAYADYDPLE